MKDGLLVRSPGAGIPVSRAIAGRTMCALLLASTALVSTLGRARGQTVEWTGTTSSDYFIGTNWSSGVVPSGSDNVLINTQTPNFAQVAVPSAAFESIVVNSLSIGSGPGANGRLSFDFADSTAGSFISATAFATPLGVGVGSGGAGQLDVNLPPQLTGTFGGQAIVDLNLLVGDGVGSHGILNVLATGKNRLLTTDNGGVSLQSASAIIGSSGGTGTANVDGGAWALFFSSGVGHDGLHVGLGAGSVGTVNVLSGGKIVYSPYFLSVGTFPPVQPIGVVIGEAGGTGTLNVSGANAAAASAVTTGAGLWVGSGAGSTGSLNILAGGKVTSYNVDFSNPTLVQPAQIGASGGTGSVLVSGAGSTLNIAGQGAPFTNNAGTTATGDLFIGTSGGTGSLTLANGGVANIGTVTFSQTGPFNNFVVAVGPANGIVYLAHDAGSTGALNFGAPLGQAPQAPGTLNAAGVVFGQGTGAIVFNHTSNNFQFNIPISGQGAIDVVAGTTVIGIDNSAGFSHQRVNFDPTTFTFNTVTETFTAGFSGFTNMFGGALILENNGAIGSSTVHGIGVATLGYGLNGLSIANPMTIDSGATLSLLADTGVSATQVGAISGAGNVDKTGGGTLTLTANNPITGEVAVDGGVLALTGAGQVSDASRVVANATFDISGVTSGASIRSLAGSGVVNLGTEMLTLTAANDLFSGVIQGTGGLTMSGGIEALSGANTYSGATDITGGTLLAGAANTFSPNSAVTVASAGTLDLNGFNQTVPSVTNAGLVNMGTNTPPGTVLTTTNYVGQGGTIAMNTFLGADNSASDRLVINSGTASGSSFLRFTNANGPGAQTTANGILVVDTINGATTAAGAFTLGNPELRAGAFDYRLFQGGPDGSDPDNWYLRSTMIGPPAPIIGPELATYGVVQPMAQQLGRAMLGTHDERLGDLYPVSCEPAETNAPPYTKAPVYAKAETYKKAADCADGWRAAVWGRLFGQQVDNHYQSLADPRTDGQVAGLQVGFDVLRSDSLIPGHKDYAGLYFAYGNANVDVSGLVTNAAATALVLQHTGSLNLNAYSGGAYWTHYGPQGWYLDLTLQGTSYSSAASTEFAHLDTSGSGFISSLETGYPIALPVFGPGFVLEPEAQVLWQWVSFDAGNDGLGPVALGTSSETTARVGLKGKWTITTDSGQVWQPYIRANFWSDFGGNSATLFGIDSIPLISHAQYMDVDAGFTTKINTYLSAFADAGYQFAVSNDGGGRRDGVKGTAGLRYQW